MTSPDTTPTSEIEDETMYVAVHSDDLPWKPYPEIYQKGGVEWKLLHTHPKTGVWTAAYRGPADAYLQPHLHSGEAHAFIVYGGFQVREPEIMEGPGYAYEMAGSSHPKSVFRIPTEFIITMNGPLKWVTEDGKHVEQDAESAAQLWAEQCAS